MKDLRKQISKGRKIGENEYYAEEVPDAIDAETKWDLYITELLSRSFSDDSLLNEYRSVKLPRYSGSWSDKAEIHEERIRRRVTFLESIVERIGLIPESPVSEVSRLSPSNQPKVFVIHGHDEASKNQVARFIEKLGLSAIILHEQPNKGRTIIEKLEKHSDVAFAVALLTPDDVGGSAKSFLKPRARQNVIFELGHFESKLGRDRVCVLYTPGVELPSDYVGVAYHEMDKAGGWQLRLAREMKAAGIPVDMNLIA